MKKWMILLLAMFMSLFIGCSKENKNYEDEIKEVTSNYKKDLVTVTKDDEEMKVVDNLIESDEASRADAYKKMEEYIEEKYKKYFSKDAYDKYLLKCSPNSIYRSYAKKTESTIEFKEIEFTNISEPKDGFVSVSCKVTFDIVDKDNKKDTITENSEMVFSNEDGKWKINSETIFLKDYMSIEPF